MEDDRKAFWEGFWYAAAVAALAVIYGFLCFQIGRYVGLMS